MAAGGRVQHVCEQAHALELQAAEHAVRWEELSARVTEEGDARRDAEARAASLESENRLMAAQLHRAEVSVQVSVCTPCLASQLSQLPRTHALCPVWCELCEPVCLRSVQTCCT